MPDAIRYCDGCNKIILPSEIKEGDAISTPLKSLCPECVKILRADEREALISASAVEAGRDTPETFELPVAQSHRPARRRPGGTNSRLEKTRKAPPSSSRMVVPAFAVAGALAGVAIVLVFRGGGSGQTSRPAGGQPAKPPARDVTIPLAEPSAPGSAAAQQLARIKTMRTPNLANYAEMRSLLIDFPASVTNRFR